MPGGLLELGDRAEVVQRRDEHERAARAARDHADRVGRRVNDDLLQADVAHRGRDGLGARLLVARRRHDGPEPHQQIGGPGLAASRSATAACTRASASAAVNGRWACARAAIDDARQKETTSARFRMASLYSMLRDHAPDGCENQSGRGESAQRGARRLPRLDARRVRLLRPDASSSTTSRRRSARRGPDIALDALRWRWRCGRSARSSSASWPTATAAGCR